MEANVQGRDKSVSRRMMMKTVTEFIKRNGVGTLVYLAISIAFMVLWPASWFGPFTVQNVFLFLGMFVMWDVIHDLIADKF